MSRPWILVTPASRGIGFALTRYLLKRTTLPILATARKDPDGVKARLLENLSPPSSSSSSPSSSLSSSSNRDNKNLTYEQRLTVLPLDVTSEPTIASASEQAAKLFPPAAAAATTTTTGQGKKQGYHLHLAFTMPGILRPEKSPRQVDADEALMTYRVNTLGPLLLMKWFGDFLPRRRTKFSSSSSGPSSFPSSSEGEGEQEQLAAEEKEGGSSPPPLLLLPSDHAVWVAMSARVGSTSDNRKGGWYSYRSSKAGVNSLVRSFDHQLAARSGDRAMALAYHPGTVRTDLSREFWATVGEDRLFTPEFAVDKMVDVVTRKVGLEGRGRCWDWKGEEILP